MREIISLNKVHVLTCARITHRRRQTAPEQITIRHIARPMKPTATVIRRPETEVAKIASVYKYQHV